MNRSQPDVKPAFTERNIPVVFATDKNYLPYVKVAINSVIANNADGNLDIIVLCSGICDESIRSFLARYAGLENVSVRFVDLSKILGATKLSEFKHVGRLPVSACYRLFLPDILTTYDKVIYLDVDTSVCRDLGDLYSVDLGDDLLGAAIDVVNSSSRPDYAEWARGHGFTEWDTYVNTGVLLLNLKAFRKDKLLDLLLPIAVEASKWFCNQDALNFVCKGRIAPLDPRWNVQLGDYCLKEQIALTGDEMWVAHFTGSQKPWLLPARRYSHLWWRNVDEMDVSRLWSAACGDALIPSHVDEPKISVVIPVYNSAKYLPEALSSVLVQNEIPEIEVICIDDGSTDDSAAILDFWKARDSRLKVVRQENQGPGVARNVGIEATKGEYIFFLDADDRVSSGAAFLQAYEQAKADDLDILIADGSIMSEYGTVKLVNGHLRRGLVPAAKVFAPDALGVNLFTIDYMDPVAKLFRRTFIVANNLRFPALKRSEDFPMVRLALSLARRLGVMLQTMVDHRIDVATSLEATKDETPLIFADAERIFRRLLAERGLLDRFERAADAAFLVNLAYNLQRVNRFASFRAVARLCAEKFPGLAIEGVANGGASSAFALKTVSAAVAAVEDTDALVDLFVDMRTATNSQFKVEESALIERIKALTAKITRLREARDRFLAERNALRERVKALTAKVATLRKEHGGQ